MAKKSGDFKFRRGDNVGTVDAENDRFLSTCFVDIGDVDTLIDCASPQCLVVGRTGSGKSALLLEIMKRFSGHTETINPEALSLNYIANSDVVSVLSRLAINLDPFFKLLWRHVLALHIFQHIRPVTEEEQKAGLKAWVARLIRHDKTDEAKAKRHERVLAFLDNYGNQEFWGDVGQRIKQIVYRFEQEFNVAAQAGTNVSLNLSSGGIGGEVSAGRKDQESEQQSSIAEITIEERQRFQSIVNEIQLRELSGILDLIEEVLEDAGRNVYIVIDKLDLQWADERIRLRLIRALIDTAISFSGVRRAKVILAMRIDLIERIYRDARQEPGTQFEKIKDHCLFVTWDRATLLQVIDGRVNKLVSDRYAPHYRVTLKDVMNPKVRKGRQKGANSVDYILERTWYRPRDVIDLVNECIRRAVGSPRITDDALLAGEGDYSRSRLRSLAEEWQLEYAYIEETIRKLLNGRTRRFRLGDISDDVLYDWMSEILEKPQIDGDRVRALAAHFSKNANADETRSQIAGLLYKAGAVGIQTDDSEKAHWATSFGYSLSSDEIRQDSMVYVHPALWKVLGIQ